MFNLRQSRLATYRDKFIQMNDKIASIKKEVMAYSNKIAGDIEKDAESIAILSESNKQLRQHIDSIYECYSEVAWEKISESLPDAEQFFGFCVFTQMIVLISILLITTPRSWST